MPCMTYSQAAMVNCSQDTQRKQKVKKKDIEQGSTSGDTESHSNSEEV